MSRDDAALWVNGRRGTVVDARDRGLQYGDGLFETMRIAGRAVRSLELHLDRLYAGCRTLSIEPPPRRTLAREIRGAAARRTDGVAKLIVTRGVGMRGYRTSGAERCNRILSLHGLPPSAEQGAGIVRVRICATRLGASPALAGLKTLNRLESVLARAEWTDPRIFEGLMLDGDENVISGTMSNLFVRRGSTILTPVLDRCGVAGIMRRRVIEACEAVGYEARERRLTWRHLDRASEVFLTNAVMGLKSVGVVERARDRLRPASTEAARRLREHLRV